MSAGKKCGVCGCENAESDFFCQHCGAEIGQAGATQAGPSAASPAPGTSKQRRCPGCGQLSDVIFPLCRHCGFDFSKAAANAPRRGRLLLLIGSESFECKDGDVLGREGTIARTFFSAIGTVSRQHARIVKRNEGWFLTVPPNVQNIAELDGHELSRGMEHPLTGEHVLKLSTQCEVRLRMVWKEE